jgi:hypothetical protein
MLRCRVANLARGGLEEALGEAAGVPLDVEADALVVTAARREYTGWQALSLVGLVGHMD